MSDDYSNTLSILTQAEVLRVAMEGAVKSLLIFNLTRKQKDYSEYSNRTAVPESLGRVPQERRYSNS